MNKTLGEIFSKQEDREVENAINTLKKLYNDKIIDPYKNSEKIIDMHTHTTASDGELSPEELIRLSIERKIGTLAITDHDTLDGIKQVDMNNSLIVDSGIKIIPGIELSAKTDIGQMHILGYNIDINNRELNEKIKILQNNSIYHVIALLVELKKDYNIVFSTDDIRELICADRNIGRPDLAKLCIKYGYASSVSDAFDKYLIDAYEKIKDVEKGLSYEECIDLITNAGGIPVLAHPKTLKRNDKDLLILIKKLVKSGLKGIEVYHSSHSKEEMNKYKKIADELGLLISGGSDYHGKIVKPDIELGTGINNNLKIKKLSILNKIK